MRSSNLKLNPIREHLFWVVLVVLLAAASYTAFSLRQPDFKPGDTDLNSYIVAKDLNPDLYSRDYFFADDNLYRFYIPWYRWLMGRLWTLTGGFKMALVSLVLVMGIIYMLGMVLLSTRLSGWVWVGLGLALLSTAYRETMGSEFWGVADMNGMLARTIYTAFSPYLFWLMFRWLSKPWLILAVVVGLSVGLAANLHPTSGVFMAGFVGLLFLLTHSRSLRGWGNLVIFLAATAIGALPIMINVFGNTGHPVPTDVSFEPFSQIVIERIKLPFRPHDFEFDLIGVTIARPLLDYLVGLYLVVSLGLVLLFFLKRQWVVERAGFIWLAGGLVVLGYGFMVALFNETLLFAIAGLYIVYRFSRPPIEASDWWSLGLLALVVLFSFVGSFVVTWIWQTFEVWGLTLLVTEQSRSARFVYMPIFFLCARAAGAWITDLQTSLDLQAGVFGWRSKPESSPSHSPSGASLALAFGLLFAIGPGILHHALDTIPGIVVGLCGLFTVVVVLAILLHTWQSSVSRGWQVGGALMVLVLISATPVGSWIADFSPVPVPMIHLGSQPEAERDDGSQALYAWAQSSTSQDALFYWCGLEYRQETHFRAKAQRSITHSWKDLVTAIYTRARLVEFYERYHRLQEACQTPQTAITMARELKADYILAPAGLPDPGLPLCFSSGRYAVYAVGEGCTAR